MSTEAEVKRKAAKARKALQERDEAIVAFTRAGASARTVAAAAGLSHAGVMKIVKRSGSHADAI